MTHSNAEETLAALLEEELEEDILLKQTRKVLATWVKVFESGEPHNQPTGGYYDALGFIVAELESIVGDAIE